MTRIHILGASGAGTSTLGAAVAAAMAVPHLDADSYYWQPTDPPFTSPYPRDVRLALLVQAVADKADWILSGSALGWAQPLEPLYQLIVYVGLDPVVRMARLRAREHRRYGQRIESGGDMNAASTEFLAWAARYDSAGPEQRSRVAHEAWLATQSAPILRLDTSRPVVELVPEVLAAANSLGS